MHLGGERASAFPPVHGKRSPSLLINGARFAWDGAAFLFVVLWIWGPPYLPATRDFTAPSGVTLAAGLVLAAAALALHLWAGVSMTSCYAHRIARASFAAWRRWLDRSPQAVLLGACSVMAVLWAASSMRRHWALGSNAWDLGIYTNALWNLTHGHGYVSSIRGGIHLFADHQTPTFWLLAPLFSAWPAPELLLIVQAVAYVTAGAALYLLARQYQSPHWVAAAMPLLFWVYLPTRNANAFDARPDSLMVPLFLWAIAGLQSTSIAGRLAGTVALLLALGCKETAAVVGAVIGIAWLFGAAPEQPRRFCRQVGAGLLIVAGAVFYVGVRVLPGLVGGSYAYDGMYSHYGGVAELALAPVLEPRTFWWQLTQPAALDYLFWTLTPLAWVPVLDWTGWLVSAPGYLMLFLANTPYRVNLAYQYSNEIVVGLLWATTRTLPALAERWPRALPVWVLGWALAATGGSEILRIRHYAPDAHALWVRTELVPALHPQRSLAASDAIVPHVSTRHWVQNLMHLRDEDGQPIGCVVTDPTVSNMPLQQSETRAITEQVLAAGYRLEYECGSVKVLAWDTNTCLVRSVACR